MRQIGKRHLAIIISAYIVTVFTCVFVIQRRSNIFRDIINLNLNGSTVLNYTVAKNFGSLPICKGFVGNATKLVSLGAPPSDMAQVVRHLDSTGVLHKLSNGGGRVAWRCRPRWHVAIIVPYRGRPAHLSLLLRHLHQHLDAFDIEYRILVVHQVPNQIFNRAKLMNVGFVEARKLNPNFDCFIFHDVDLIPVTKGLPYECSDKGPLHMVPSMDKFVWSMPYGSYFGGVCAINKTQFELMNGFSNLYWGWGGEDDDGWTRVYLSGQKPQRLPKHLGRYVMIRHERDRLNIARQSNGRLLRWQLRK